MLVSSASCLETVTLAQRGRIEIDGPPATWVARALAQDRVLDVPVDAQIAVAAALLLREGFHSDPLDMLIFATARVLGAPLVTKDRLLRSFDRAATIW